MALGVCVCVTLLLSTVTGSHSRSSIVGGEDAARGSWPWMVYLYITDGTHSFPCGGSLINSQWVLTAGHCIFNPPLVSPDADRSYVRVGELKLRRPTGVSFSIRRFLLHPDYRLTTDTVFNDIALVQLQEAVPFSDTVAPVGLPSPRDVFSANAECWVTGWGLVTENRKLGGDQTLQQLKLPLVDGATCRRIYPNSNHNMLCAGYLQGGKDACTGDSGGPLVCKSFGQFVQVGVVSFGHGCARRDYAGVYTRVNSYATFIKDAIRTHGSS
ncbi:serine protease 27-like [Clupea harengus]|uniref:Serine protease 27-like n=1 Tax=Clupea harengus TaxID=7950 RepID=A0A6P8EKV2_CLUHA|nr:serine protease 27-like [Clupea harengus]